MSRTRVWVSLLLFVGVCTLVVVLLFETLLQAVGDFCIYRSKDFQHAEVALVLAGSVPDRVLAARDLLSQGAVSKVILTRAKKTRQEVLLKQLDINIPSEIELNSSILEKTGTRKSEMEILPGLVDSTYQEALSFRDFASKRKIRSVAVVTCKFHSYRATLNFRNVLEDTGIEVYSVPSKYCSDDPARWWKNERQFELVCIESANLVAYWLGIGKSR